jgi:hypothetical protein
MNENKEELDTHWITEFEKTDKLYRDFYLDDIYFVNLQFIYINQNNDIEKIREEIFLMKNPNIISREEVIGILKRNSYDENKKRYMILSLLKFNITLEPEDITSFLKNSKSKNQKYDETGFLIPIKHIDTITFRRTINMFHDLNTLYFVFLENNEKMDETTRKNISKRIYLHLKKKHKKTIKKYY